MEDEILEKRIGLIPKVVVSGGMGPKEYAVLLTDQKSLFVLEKKTKAGLGYAIGGIVGAAIANTLASPGKTFDYENVSLDQLAAEKDNIVVPHSRVERIRVKNGFSSSVLRMEYVDSMGKKRKLQALLVPPPELIAQKKQEGLKLKAVRAEYSRSATRAFDIALPPSVAQKCEWRV
jgi:hypothetical protein